MTAVFNIASPDPGVSQNQAVNLRSFAYGDGYSQNVADGLNNVWATYTLNWTGRSQATIQSMDDFFIAMAGAPFFWTNPRGQTQKYTCVLWVPDYEVSTSCGMQATLISSFEP